MLAFGVFLQTSTIIPHSLQPCPTGKPIVGACRCPCDYAARSINRPKAQRPRSETDKKTLIWLSCKRSISPRLDWPSRQLNALWRSANGAALSSRMLQSVQKLRSDLARPHACPDSGHHANAQVADHPKPKELARVSREKSKVRTFRKPSAEKRIDALTGTAEGTAGTPKQGLQRRARSLGLHSSRTHRKGRKSTEKAADFERRSGGWTWAAVSDRAGSRKHRRSLSPRRDDSDEKSRRPAILRSSRPQQLHR